MGRSRYLDFGGAPSAAGLDLDGTQVYLESLGFGRGPLIQAREALAARREVEYTFDALGSRYCDFCFVQLMGGEYEILKDGRERCSRCSRSVLSTHEQFVEEFHQVRRNMEAAFGISLSVPVIVRMVNAKEIARRSGEPFTPTSGVDSRVLGFVKKTGDGHEFYIENGAPRLAAVTTIAHELTHIWQYANWDEAAIAARYGSENRLMVYEGMATWVEIQYLLGIKDVERARREEAFALARDDVYGDGFKVFAERYPLQVDGDASEDSPFRTAFPL
jgi:hypothetical protein